MDGGVEPQGHIYGVSAKPSPTRPIPESSQNFSKRFQYRYQAVINKTQFYEESNHNPPPPQNVDVFAFILSVTLHSMAQAESFTEDDRFIVQYNAFNSSVVTPKSPKPTISTAADTSAWSTCRTTQTRRRPTYPPTYPPSSPATPPCKPAAKSPEFAQISEGDVMAYIGANSDRQRTNP